jgi:hypothetical protein
MTMHQDIKYGVIPTKQGLEELSQGLENFLTDHKFFRCSEVTFEREFLKIRAFHDQARNFLTIYIPTQYVACVVEHSEGRPAIGFRPDALKNRALGYSDPGGTLPPDD